MNWAELHGLMTGSQMKLAELHGLMSGWSCVISKQVEMTELVDYSE